MSLCELAVCGYVGCCGVVVSLLYVGVVWCVVRLKYIQQ